MGPLAGLTFELVEHFRVLEVKTLFLNIVSSLSTDFGMKMHFCSCVLLSYHQHLKTKLGLYQMNILCLVIVGLICKKKKKKFE